MEITITKGSPASIDACEAALVRSELGRRYFAEEGSARRSLEEGFSKNEIYIAADRENVCRGFVWLVPNGIFHSFPYLHIVAVNEEDRGRGIGRKLLEFAESLCFEASSKLFLVVADFNPGAKKLYERLGYTEVGRIPGLYRPGIAESLMMKVRK